jgi:hypothetical protein
MPGWKWKIKNTRQRVTLRQLMKQNVRRAPKEEKPENKTHPAVNASST